MNIRINGFLILQLILKSTVCIATTVFIHDSLMQFNFMEHAINYIVTRLEWTNYGVWFWHTTGFLIASLRQAGYEYKQAQRRKDNIQKNKLS